LTELRKKCETCNKYLIAVDTGDKKLLLHPDSVCSGLTDAVDMTIEVDDEALQKIWNQKYGHPKYSDHELLNKIWKSKILNFLIKHLIK